MIGHWPTATAHPKVLAISGQCSCHWCHL